MVNLPKENIKFLILHHTATPRDFTTISMLRQRFLIAFKEKYIGYHYVILGDGSSEKTRPLDMIGRHCLADSMNTKSIGIALAGNFERELPNELQILKLKSLLSYLCREYKISSENVLGHREVRGAKTLCPGQHFQDWIYAWRYEREKKIKLLSRYLEILKTLITLYRRLINLYHRDKKKSLHEVNLKRYKEDDKS